MTTKLRAYTPGECRAMLLDHFDLLLRTVLHDKRVEGTEDKMRLLVHSMLCVFDGVSGGLPAFDITPAPHPGDRLYDFKQGDKWWPVDRRNIADGKLHSRWGRRKP